MYDIFRSHIVPLKERLLYSLYIVFDQPILFPDDVGDTCAQLAAETMVSIGAIDAIIIFAFSDKIHEKYSYYDLGRCLLTRDGKGWIGDSRALDGRTPDRKWIACYEPSPWKEADYIDVSFYFE